MNIDESNINPEVLFSKGKGILWYVHTKVLIVSFLLSFQV